MPSQSTMPVWHLFFPLMTARMSLVVSSGVLPVTSISHVLPFCVCRASTRHVSRISAARFSLSLASGKLFFCMSFFSSFGFLRRTKMWVIRLGGVTALA